ncbi:Double-stranded RNA-binding protein 4 [Camellia lanceoleosa]|uniref:Double-stranded RNA-binding protein 4 n=1 Tax=Camellia lanceoleosa TaxID=1840588 RepID=A0ACC0H7W4_9ERIC|nr:Double-stranded RNA-binding protein 4 [Camellia lanceoleosa]
MSAQNTESQDPQLVVLERPPQTQSSTTNLLEHLMYKNRLQEYTQRSAIDLPVYNTIKVEGQNPPRFRSTVLVNGAYYTSPCTFSNRKAAEQDVAKIALDGTAQRIKDEVCCLIRKDTVFCKSILNEYAVKTNLEKPTYNTIQPGGLLPVFVSSLIFNGVMYTGEAGRNKKEAEQLAARAVILSVLDNSDPGTVIFEIIKSKFRLYAALHKVKDLHNTLNGITPVAANTLSSPLGKGKEVEVTGGTRDVPSTAISETCSGQLTNIQAIQQSFHEFKELKSEPSHEAINPPIVSVPPVLEQALDLG